MDKELASLLVNYKACLEQIFEINNKVDQLNTSEQLAANNEKTPEKVTELISKVKLDVDTALKRRCTEANTAKSDVQYYIDDALWNCACRTTLKPTKESDKYRLEQLMCTLFDIEKQSHDTIDDENSVNQFHEDLHQWLLQVATIYITVYTEMEDQKRVFLFLLDTPHVIWAVPLIQLPPIYDTIQMDSYIEIMSQLLEKATWTEEDNYLAILDQLTVDYHYGRFLESYRSKDNEKEADLLNITNKLTNILFNGTRRFHDMRSLTKRLCQTIIQITQLFIEGTNYDQDRIDTFLTDLIDLFHNTENYTTWIFLPQFPFKALSIQALWQLTLQLLHLDDFPEPVTLEKILESPLDMDPFKSLLEDNQTHGIFMLNSLTNVCTSIPSGVDQLSQHDPIATCILIVVSYVLFQIAFIDKELRSMYYRDVRDHFDIVCQQHSFIASLLLRWTVEHMSKMQNMALYLFHSLPINKWTVLKNDLKWLHQLLLSESTVDIQLAKYIIENLNYGYTYVMDTEISKSQPWHSRRRPFLGYDIHEDLAFLILDACQRFQPLSDTNKGTIDLVTSAVVSNYIATNSGNDFIHWSWTIVQRLKLYDCPLSTRAADIELSLTPTFLRTVLNSYSDMSASHSALVIYVSLMLSATSRHFLRFESGDGWLKLLTILKRGKPEAVIQIMSEMIPSFVYMHGDDLFNDASLSDFLKHLFLTKVQMESIIGANVWQAQLIDDSVMDQGFGFSYVDLMIHCWLKTVFRKNDWINQRAMVAIMDSLCRLAFILKRRKLIHPMLIEEYRRLERQGNQQLQQQQQQQQQQHFGENNGSPNLARFIRSMVYEGNVVPTLLANNDEWFGLRGINISKAPGINNHHIWFVFEALLAETAVERPYREEILKENFKHPKRPLDFFSIYRWLQHILIVPVDHPLLPLFLQMFFCLHYQKLDDTTTLGSILFNKKPELLSKLRDYIANVQTYFGQKMIMAPDLAERFQQLYYAMWLWLGHNELLKHDYDLQQLPTHYNVDRLKLCYLRTEDEQPWYDESLYWVDLVDRNRLLQEFMQYPWESSERFRTKGKSEDCSTSSLKSRRSKMTSESTAAPLPPVYFREPNKVT
ncbi:hypothetical protein G6F55_003696 [Rhizopus delemar]|uniref:Epg5-like TPR domain-containing protein n=2 Tax=Rhizopus TaxID=4842 RepID=A0A9P7CSH9_9FUNG|nr:hypothetical protein G6F55_003696 [Rhizopus delemar]KAG1549017.1 hypothetical protein G6F51_003311 [Rhizopus arrhizus]KAG1524122.1 hypothetical protein G6F52_004458 [Rhizopus delemar]KAG1556436.1 hypothetical protein G6F49_006270 [Rhizopus delemar]KAG1573432.1 hypothetical protein G6F50_002852 [Rhizopus delemar]